LPHIQPRHVTLADFGGCALKASLSITADF
jgi:hypothetical protein